VPHVCGHAVLEMNDLFDEAECTRLTKGGDGSSDTRTSA